LGGYLASRVNKEKKMETSNRYIIVANSGRGRHKAWKILDLHRAELLPDVYDYKPFEECLALNKKKNGVVVIEHAPIENAAEQPRALDLLSGSAKSASLAQPANQ
jgi:hypothetical protein